VEAPGGCSGPGRIAEDASGWHAAGGAGDNGLWAHCRDAPRGPPPRYPSNLRVGGAGGWASRRASHCVSRAGCEALGTRWRRSCLGVNPSAGVAVSRGRAGAGQGEDRGRASENGAGGQWMSRDAFDGG
jgi:hypothetical protein